MIDEYKKIIASEYQDGQLHEDSIDDIMHRIASKIVVNVLPVEYRVVIAQTILATLSLEDRKKMAMKLLQEQVIEQRNKLNY